MEDSIMSLPQSITNFLNESAGNVGVPSPTHGEDLFKTGVLDSFALVDLVTVLEGACGFKIPDSDVVPANFQTLKAIEDYIDGHHG
jgi:acyl carrier protein